MLLTIIVVELPETLLMVLMVLAVETVDACAIGLLWPYTNLVLVRWVVCVVPTHVRSGPDDRRRESVRSRVQSVKGVQIQDFPNWLLEIRADAAIVYVLR